MSHFTAVRPFAPLLAALLLAGNCGVSAQDAPLTVPPLPREQQQHWRDQIRSALFCPNPLPPLQAQSHGKFEPTSDVIAERITYQTQFGLRVPAILYLPKKHRGKIPALIVVNGHGGDKYSWYAFYSGVMYARG